MSKPWSYRHKPTYTLVCLPFPGNVTVRGVFGTKTLVPSLGMPMYCEHVDCVSGR